MKNLSLVLPTLILMESMAAGLIYLLEAKWGSALYWFSAGALVLAVTFVIPKFG